MNKNNPITNPIDIEDLQTAYYGGQDARKQGKSPEDNPYGCLNKSARSQAKRRMWIRGFNNDTVFNS